MLDLLEMYLPAQKTLNSNASEYLVNPRAPLYTSTNANNLLELSSFLQIIFYYLKHILRSLLHNSILYFTVVHLFR